AMLLLDEFFRTLETGPASNGKLVRVKNLYSEKSETWKGMRLMELNLLHRGGLQVSACGRPDKSLNVSLVGEVQIYLKEFICVRKRRHLLYKFSKGHFDWGPEDEDPESDEEDRATPGVLVHGNTALFSDDVA
ncbi:unnamed protein product, partial [Polarella glacialis]